MPSCSNTASLKTLWSPVQNFFHSVTFLVTEFCFDFYCVSFLLFSNWREASLEGLLWEWPRDCV